MTKLKIKHYFGASVAAMLVLNSCSNTKFLQEGQLLYTGAEVNIKNDTLTKKEKSNLAEALEDQMRP